MFYNIKKQHDSEYGKRTRELDRGFKSAKDVLENRHKKLKLDKSQSTLTSFLKPKNDDSNNVYNQKDNVEKVEENEESPKFTVDTQESNDTPKEQFSNEEINESKSIIDKIASKYKMESYCGKESEIVQPPEQFDGDEVINKSKLIMDKITSKYSKIEPECKEEVTKIEPCQVPEITNYIETKVKIINVTEEKFPVNEEITYKKKKKHTHHRSERKASHEHDDDVIKNVDVKKGHSKQKIGQFIVQLLMPAYTQKKFESKDIFKSVARKITHDVMSKNLAGKKIITL